MAGRCGCSSSNATGASLTGGDCIVVTGAGTPASPAVIGVVIDPAASNNVECGTNGLYAATAQVQPTSCIAVAGDGSLATPYALSPIISDADEQILECTGDGLFAPAPQISPTSCIDVEGDGSVATPFLLSPIISDADGQMIACTDDGLFAPMAQIGTTDDALTITGEGTVDAPYVVAVDLSDDLGQGISKLTDGLYALRAPTVQQGASTLFGGALPADPEWIIQSGTHVGSTDASGHLTVPIFGSLGGLLSITFNIGDRPLTQTEANIDMASVGLTGFDVVMEDANAYGTPIVAGTYRVNYTVIGWAA